MKQQTSNEVISRLGWGEKFETTCKGVCINWTNFVSFGWAWWFN
ncbi:hypothetical protein [uncultured Bacteroides sp.]|nr:hypothetical protein [uncultured Bacteroides sp.]